MRKIKRNKKKYKRDIKYKSKLVTYFINNIMRNGKKNIANKIFYKTLNYIEKQFKNKNLNPLQILKIAINNGSPEVEIKTRKIGGATYNMPIRINNKRKIYLSIKWLILNSKKKKNESMFKRLAKEIILTYNGIGETIKKKNQIHKIAESNKAFSHFKF
ncbi:MAG: 30S ribosomal protein S7 [Candidatus Shikimatogenerans bostrichidophilus]|nr:MAG: 30S ribosomal protein S7 [Candidatus Shikimatogenerans bostrichidophilus]